MRQTHTNTTQSLTESQVYAGLINAQGELCIVNSQGRMQPFSESLLLSVKGSVNVVWVPTEQVLLTRVFVPGKRQTDWQQALPFVLEESISEPIEQFHLVIYQRNQDGWVSVALVEHKRMQAWLSQLEQAGLAQAMLIPDCFRVAWSSQAEQSHWRCYQQGDMVWARTSADSGLVAEQAWFELYRQQAGEPACDSVATLAVAATPSTAKLNLRTAEYRTQSLRSDLLQKTKWLGLVAMLLVITLVAEQLWQNQRVVQEVAAYQQQTQALFKQLFPEVKRVVNVRAQTQAFIQTQNSVSQQQGSLIELLLRVSPVFEQHEALQIERIQWQATEQQGALRFDLSAPESGVLQSLLEQVQQALVTQGQQKARLEIKQVSPSKAEGVLYVDF